MIKKLEIQRFKSIEHCDLNFGKLNIFIGTNASGKSNFFDALRVMQGIGYGLTVDEIFNGKTKTSSALEWQEIRGGSEWAVYRPNTIRPYRGKQQVKDEQFTFESIWDVNGKDCDFKITMNPTKGNVIEEELRSNGYAFYFTDETKNGVGHRVTVCPAKPSRPPKISFERHKPVLHQIFNSNERFYDANRYQELGNIIKTFSDIQKLDLVPSVLRQPTRKSRATRMGERGEDFPAILRNIIRNSAKKESLTKWLQLLTPSDINDIKPLRTKIGDIYFGVREGKKIVYAPSLSDGTLRFAALLSALFQPSEPSLLLIEEIENGIHPTRLKLLAELLQSRSDKSDSQIFVTTHSPLFLAWLDPSMYQHVFFCYRMEDGSSRIKALTDVPHLMETVKKYSVSELFAEGWMESSIMKEEQ